jgi:ribonuclease BN (tRNA processing enzyme)
MFNLTVLGKYGAYPVYKGATSGYLISYSGNHILSDIGSGVFSRLKSIINPMDLKAVILSHLHFDHISDLGILNYYLLLNNKKLKVYCPFKNSPIDFKTYSNLTFYPIEDNIVLNIENIKLTFYEMKHPLISYGYKAEFENKILSFTGDTNYCENVEELAKNSNLFLCDGAFLQKDYTDKKPHMSIEMCCKIGEKYNTKVLITHLSPTYSNKEIKSAIKGYKNADIAKELKEYKI